MSARNLLQAMLVLGALGAGSCSRAPSTAPTVTPAVVPSDYEYDVRFTYADEGYTVTRFEYADPTGVVRNAVYQTPWKQTLTLKPGDRMYVRVEVDYPSGLAGGIQIVGRSSAFYRSAGVERLDGPTTAVLVIDEIVR